MKYKIIIPEEPKAIIYYCKQNDPYCISPNCRCNTVKIEDTKPVQVLKGQGATFISGLEEPKTNLERLPFTELMEEFAKYYEKIPLVEDSKQETLEEPKFHVGQRVIVCNTLKTTITKIEDEKYYFLDEIGNVMWDEESSLEPIIEPKQETLEESKQKCCQDVSGYYLGTICPKCNKPFRSVIQEPKQETLEEVLKNELEFIDNSCRNFDFDLGFKTGGLIGAKWQQEQNTNKYSEEEVLELLIKSEEFTSKYSNRTDLTTWFKQHKK